MNKRFIGIALKNLKIFVVLGAKMTLIKMKTRDFETVSADISELKNNGNWVYRVCLVHMIQSICEAPCIPAPPLAQCPMA